MKTQTFGLDLPQTGDVFPTEDVKQEKEDQEDVLRRSKRQIEISEDEGLCERNFLMIVSEILLNFECFSAADL